MISGIVTDAGGGFVTILVDRDTDQYPTLGGRVELRPVQLPPPTGHRFVMVNGKPWKGTIW